MGSNSRKTQILKEIFGYDSFRKGQEEIVDQILNGRDVLAIMPTGAGKSLCYQVPALLMSGITIVVSPLISLMIDQVKALNEAGVHAAYINSALSERQITKALELAAAGRYKMIYVAPERLLTPRFLDFACHTELSMVTIDEAHCISQWGQNFRPSYVKITEFIRQLPRRPVLLRSKGSLCQNRIHLYKEIQDQVLQEYAAEHGKLLPGGRQSRTRRRTGRMYPFLFTAGYHDQSAPAG